MLLLTLLWTYFVLIAPERVYWRDSGEFLISAYFLDIPHPAGFPLYNQLANIFALLPLGQIAWRIHCFSALIAVALGFLSFLFSYLLMHRGVGLSQRLSRLLATASPLILLSSVFFTRQAVSAEAYMLMAFMGLAILICYTQYHITQDLRWLLSAFFLAGLSCAVHVAIVPFLLICIIIIFSEFKKLKPIIPAGLALFLLGLSLYIYIPVRATKALPLNTASVVTLKRAISYFTNKRGSELRPVQTAQSSSKQIGIAGLFDGILKRVRNCMPLGFIPLALIGLIFCLRIDLRLGIAISAAIFFNWYFFHNWDPDPWIFLIALFSVLCPLALAGLTQLLSHKRRNAAAMAGFLLCSIVSVLHIPQALQEASAFEESRSTEIAARRVLSQIPSEATVVLQHSWFIARYLQSVAGYRQDIALQYLPALLYPEYFRPSAYESEKARFAVAPTATQSQLAGFIDFASLSGDVFFEADRSLNPTVLSIAQLTDPPLIKLSRGQSAYLAETYQQQLIAYLQSLKTSDSNSLLQRADTQNYIEVLTAGLADLYASSGFKTEAAELLASVCTPFKRSPCSEVSLNNLLLYASESQQFKLALQALAAAVQRKQTLSAAMQHNSKLLFDALPEELKRDFLQIFPDQAILKQDTGELP